MTTSHKHQFKPRQQKVLLAQYRHEDGEIRYKMTTGADVLQQRACACGTVYTYDLKRTLA